MLHLLSIDLKKLAHYRTFWVVCGLYFLTLGFTTASGMEFLKWFHSKSLEFGASVNIDRIPIYHFPDIWQNLIYISGFFKLILAFMVVISVTNEFTYRTIRQNIIDGLSRSEFLLSKVYTNVLLSLLSCAMVFVIITITGLLYTPGLEFRYVFSDMEFLAAYFLEVFAFLSYTLMLGLLIQRSGLTIVVLCLSHMLEAIVKANIDEALPWSIRFFPMESISNLVAMPFPRYLFQEIQDYVSISSVAIALVWTGAFNYISYWKLKKSDL
jgi:ABC-type transport system involved in multi-copper enzyme maturation permease subunit